MSVTLTPFLYRTSTIQKLSRCASASTNRCLLFSSTASTARKAKQPFFSHESPIPFQLPPGFKLAEKEKPAADTEDGPTDTITPTERDVFGTIFDEIAARRQRNGLTEARQSSDLGISASRPDVSHRFSTSQPPPSGSGSKLDQIANKLSAINHIMQDAANQHLSSRNAREQAAKPWDSTLTAIDRDETLSSFPPSLRGAAQTALGIAEPSLDKDDGAEPTPGLEAEADIESLPELTLSPATISELNRVRELRSAEQNRVESMMSAAESDFDLWAVMECEVFSMVDKLGIGYRSPAPVETPEKPGRRRKRAATGAKNGTIIQAQKEEKLNREIFGLLYPSHLLYGLRLLGFGFARPSPLALSVLPRIKQLGTASYVLGAPTPLYNALISIHWYRYNDVAAVSALLDEMRHSGLEFNEDTLRIVRDAEEQLATLGTGEKGAFLRGMSHMPEFDSDVLSGMTNWGLSIKSAVERAEEV